MIVASTAEGYPIVYIWGHCGETFVWAHGARCWRRRTDAVGAVRFAVTREITQRQGGPSAQPRKLFCKSLANKFTSSNSTWVSASMRIAGLPAVSEQSRRQDVQ